MTRLRGARIELWVEWRSGAPALNPVMRSLLQGLEEAGARTRVRVPEMELLHIAELRGRDVDLVLLKSASTLALSWAVALEQTGGRFLNSARNTVLAHDKAWTVARLSEAGLPVPETFLVTPDALSDGASSDQRWVSKPTRGVHGRGVNIHADFPKGDALHGEVQAVDSYIVDDMTRLVQRFVGDVQADMKVYAVGNRCFSGLKEFNVSSYATDCIDAQPLPSELATIVREAGQALGLRCFGVDLRFQSGQPFIIDANPFPGFRGFPEAVSALRAEIERSLECQA